MTKIKTLTNFNINIHKLQNYVNKLYKGDNTNEILLIMFNSVINSYPNKEWMNLEDTFFINLPTESVEQLIVHTILSYKLGIDYLKKPIIIQNDLENVLINKNVSPYNLHKYASTLLTKSIYDLTTYAYDNHLIKPRHIYKLITDYFELDNVNLKEATKLIQSFIKEHEIKIFNGNYYFFNIYKCLRKLTTLSYYPEDTSAIDLIPLFNTIENEETKKRIQDDFANIENSNKQLIEKIEDSIVVAHHYSYDLPLAKKREPKD